ncbi:2-oxoacid:ferredoxin oxidoreductase subunit beta, partial [Nonomuraea ferruginea]
LVHDAHNPDPSVAFALSRLDEPAFDHAPIGIFRSVDRPAYDTLMTSQLDEAVAQKGRGDLTRLFDSGDTWRVP